MLKNSNRLAATANLTKMKQKCSVKTVNCICAVDVTKITRSGQPFSEHVVVDVADISSGEPVVNRRRKCKKHQSETQDYYCTDCRKYVCFRCRVDELHVREGHIILMLNTEEHEENFKRKIEGLKTMAENKIMSTNKFIGNY